MTTVAATPGAPWVFLLAAVVGYLLGSVNPAAIIARIRGIDLRASGSGNPGATNAGRVMGKKTGILVGVLDVVKGFLPAIIFLLAVSLPAAEVAGFFAVVGHITSPFLKGRGGKGVATTLGAIMGTHLIWLPFVLVGFLAGYLTSRRVGIGAVCGAVVLIVCGVVTPVPSSRWFAIILGLLVLARHWKNIAAVWQDWRLPPDPAEPTDPADAAPSTGPGEDA